MTLCATPATLTGVIGETLCPVPHRSVARARRNVRRLARAGLVLDRHVAVKLLHARRLESEDAVERFEREARTLASLDAPGHRRPSSTAATITAARSSSSSTCADATCASSSPSRGRSLDDGARDRPRGRRRARLRPRARRDPPRRQAAQRAADARRPRQAHRLRHRAHHSRAIAHDRRAGCSARVTTLRPEQAAGRRARRARRRLRPRRDALPRAHRRGRRTAASQFVEIAEQHALAPIPSVARVRPTCRRARRDLARSLAKRPEDRYPDVRGAARRPRAAARRPARRATRGHGEIPSVSRAPPVARAGPALT